MKVGGWVSKIENWPRWQKVVLAFFVLLVVWFVLRFVIGGSEDNWICVDGQWVRHGVPSVPQPIEPCY